MSFSSFSRFGHTGFSSAQQLGRVLFDSAVALLGPAYDRGRDSHRMAALYADAMGLASAIWTLRRVRNQQTARKCTDLLPAMESLFGIVPRPGESDNRRRERLHTRMLIAQGGREDVVSALMQFVFGSDFLSWEVADAGNLVRFPDTATEAAEKGNFVPPGTRARILVTTAPIFVGVNTVTVSDLTRPLEDQALVGVSFCIDPNIISRRESSEFTDVLIVANRVVTITATFASAHDVGAVITTQYMPLWRSSAHWHTFRLASEAARDPDKRREAGNELRRTMKSVAKWGLTEAGPFTVGEGLIGITEIG